MGRSELNATRAVTDRPGRTAHPGQRLRQGGLQVRAPGADHSGLVLACEPFGAAVVGATLGARFADTADAAWRSAKVAVMA